MCRHNRWQCTVSSKMRTWIMRVSSDDAAVLNRACSSSVPWIPLWCDMVELGHVFVQETNPIRRGTVGGRMMPKDLDVYLDRATMTLYPSSRVEAHISSIDRLQKGSRKPASSRWGNGATNITTSWYKINNKMINNVIILKLHFNSSLEYNTKHHTSV